MTIELRMLLKAAEGALLRVLGTIERRGFGIARMQASPHAATDGNEVGIELKVQIEPRGRAVDVLVRQLQRLYDVVDARLQVAQPVFDMPAALPVMPKHNRRGLSALGIPERAGASVSNWSITP